MATKLIAGTHREVWQQAAQDGGTVIAVPTGIVASQAVLARVRAELVLTGATGAPDVSAVASIASGHVLVTVTNAGPAGNSAAWILDVQLLQSMDQGRSTAGPTVPVLAPNGAPTLLTGNSIATWPTTLVRHFLVDQLNGNDANVGYVDAPTTAASIDSTGRAVKTIARYLELIPRDGCGRMAISHFANTDYANGTHYTDALDYRGFGGYSYFMKRAWTNFDPTIACWSARDRAINGAKNALAGPNPDSSWSVNTLDMSKALVITVAAGGAALANEAATGCRVRFTGNITAALQDVCVPIYKTAVDTIEFLSNPATMPVAGDTFWIELPGVALDAYYELTGAMATLAPGQGFNSPQRRTHNYAIGFDWIAKGFEWPTSLPGLVVIGSVHEPASYAFCHQSCLTSSPVDMVDPQFAKVRWDANYYLPSGTLTSTASPNRFSAPSVNFECDQMFFNGSFFATHAPTPGETNHGQFNLYANKVILYNGVFLGGASVYTSSILWGVKNWDGELTRRNTRIVRVLEYNGATWSNWESAPSGGAINAIFLDDAVLKLGTANPASTKVALRLADITGGATVDAAASGKKVGIYARHTADWSIELGAEGGDIPTATGADGDIYFANGTFLSYAQLAKADFVDTSGSHWVGAAGVVQEGYPRAGAALTNADVVIAPGTDKCSLYVLPAATLTGNHQVTVDVTNMIAGQAVCIRRRDLTANTYAVVNGGPGAGTLVTLPATPGAVIDAGVKFDGTNMVLDRTVCKDA